MFRQCPKTLFFQLKYSQNRVKVQPMVTGQILICLDILLFICALESLCRAAKVLLTMIAFVVSLFLPIGQHVFAHSFTQFQFHYFSFVLSFWLSLGINCPFFPFFGYLVCLGFIITEIIFNFSLHLPHVLCVRFVQVSSISPNLGLKLFGTRAGPRFKPRAFAGVLSSSGPDEWG
jgi:hypothetical protein